MNNNNREKVVLKPDPNKKHHEKSTRFQDETSTIPVSKNYLYDYHDDEVRRDAHTEFRSKRGTYIGTIVVGLIVITVGCVLTWVGSHYNLNDFYIIGPVTLIMGCGMTGVGIALLIRAIVKTKHANVKVVQGSTPVPFNANNSGKPKSANFSERSFITSSDVSVHGVNSRMGSSYSHDVNNDRPDSGKSTPISTVFPNDDPPDVSGNDNYNNSSTMYNSRDIETSPVPKVVAGHKVRNKHYHHRDVHNSPQHSLYDSRNIETSPVPKVVPGRKGHYGGSDTPDNCVEIQDDNGHVYHISVPNEPIMTGEEDGEEGYGSIPDPALYLEPNEINNKENRVTFF